MFNRVKNVRTLPDMILQIEFLDGTAKLYDVKPLMDKWAVFKKLKHNALFDLARVEVGGYGNVFLTTDDRLLRTAKKLDLKINIANPVFWLMEVMNNE